MKNQKQKNSYILIGIILILFGIMLILLRQNLLTFLMQIVALMLIGSGFLHFLRNFHRLNHGYDKQEINLISFEGILTISISLWILFDESASMEIVSLILGAYLILIGLISLISAILLFINHIATRFSRLFFAIFHILLGWQALQLSSNQGNSLVFIGFYIIALGTTYIFDGFGVYQNLENRQEHRRPRVALPVIFKALYPFRSMNKIKKVNKKQPDNSFVNSSSQPLTTNVFTIILTTNSGEFDKFGHIGFAYRNRAYDYGNHDSASRHFYGSIGDGVVAIADRRAYIDFLVQKGTTIIEYDVPLDKEQDAIINQKIQELMAQTEAWQVPLEQKDSYAWKLMTESKADFRKFNTGKFKYYFVLGINCVLITDEVIGSLGIDNFMWTAFLSPGTYLDFLEKEYNKSHSWISERRITTKKIKIKI